MIPSISPLSSDSVFAIPFAKHKFYELERMRLMNGLPLSKKVLSLGIATIIITSSDTNNSIILYGKSSPYQILLAGSDLFGYDYENNKLTQGKPNTTNGTTINQTPLGNTIVGSTEVKNPKLKIGQRTALHSEDFLFTDYTFGVSAYSNGSSLVLADTTTCGTEDEPRNTYDPVTISQLPISTLNKMSCKPGPHFIATEGNFLTIGGTAAGDIDALWNKFNTSYHYYVNQANSNSWENFNWVPSIYAAEAGSGEIRGWHYGFPKIKSNIDPYEGLEVTFNGVLDCRATTTKIVKHGYAETITRSIGGDEGPEDRREFRTWFFLVGTEGIVGNSAMAYESMSGATYSGTAWAPNFPVFSINSKETLGLTISGTDPNIHFWTFDEPVDPEEDSILPITRDMMGCVIEYNGKAALYRIQIIMGDMYPGGSAALIKTFPKYHSHSVSFDGKIVSVFSSENGTDITSVDAYDFFVYRSDEDVENGISLTDKMTLRVSGDVTKAKATHGEIVLPSIIPEKVPALTRREIEPVDLGHYNQPHLATMKSSTLYAAYPSIHKVICDDGIHAATQFLESPCWKFEMTVINQLEGGVNAANDCCEASDVSVWYKDEEFSSVGIFDLEAPFMFKYASPRNHTWCCKWEWFDNGPKGTPIWGYWPAPVSGITAGENTEMDIHTQYAEIPLVRMLAGGIGYWPVYPVLGGYDEDTIKCMEPYDGGGSWVPDYKCYCGTESPVETAEGEDPKVTYSFDMYVESLCGQEVKRTMTRTTDKLAVLGPSDITTGAYYAMAGGIGSSNGNSYYTITTSCGEIDGDEPRIGGSLIIDSSGCCGPETVTVTDECGDSVTRDVRGPGTWVTTGGNYPAGSDKYFMVRKETSALTRTTYYYMRTHSICSSMQYATGGYDNPCSEISPHRVWICNGSGSGTHILNPYDICGDSAGLPAGSDEDGYIGKSSNASTYQAYSSSTTIYVGWHVYGKNLTYFRDEEWVCP